MIFVIDVLFAGDDALNPLRGSFENLIFVPIALAGAGAIMFFTGHMIEGALLWTARLIKPANKKKSEVIRERLKKRKSTA